jgi:Ribonuclease G/E
VSAKTQMLVNYVPGEECRVALLHDGKLEELHAERFDNASHVGNIYLGRVQNVEAGIQAAFVDFGLGENGFRGTSPGRKRTRRSASARKHRGASARRSRRA